MFGIRHREGWASSAIIYEIWESTVFVPRFVSIYHLTPAEAPVVPSQDGVRAVLKISAPDGRLFDSGVFGHSR